MTKKFRIWSPYHQKFVIKGAEFGLERLFENIYIKIKGTWNRNQDYEAPTNVNSYIVQQWTGLTDSQGVEIYEGDIVSFQEKKWEVKFKNFSWFLVNDLPNKMESWWLAICNSPKVIGNIFETSNY